MWHWNVVSAEQDEQPRAEHARQTSPVARIIATTLRSAMCEIGMLQVGSSLNDPRDRRVLLTWSNVDGDAQDRVDLESA